MELELAPLVWKAAMCESHGKTGTPLCDHDPPTTTKRERFDCAQPPVACVDFMSRIVGAMSTIRARTQRSLRETLYTDTVSDSGLRAERLVCTLKLMYMQYIYTVQLDYTNDCTIPTVHGTWSR